MAEFPKDEIVIFLHLPMDDHHFVYGKDSNEKH
jgi:hypothetical protein